MFFRKLSKKKKIAFIIIFILIIIYCFILPSELFNKPVCTVITDKNDELLGAHIASDGQYRFPDIKEVPAKFEKAIIAFEDKRFKYHWGFDFLAFSRAIKQNISQNKIVSGGSTLTMQVIRLSRNKSRTVLEKIFEIILATRLEFSYSKKEILSMYASNAPFGGNVVGLEAAGWRYFGTSPDKLTWAESAMLAVLPNSPALIHPGKNRTNLLKKRNKLLKKLYKKEIIDEETYILSIDEPIPDNPNPFPNLAPHLLAKTNAEKNISAITKTTVDIETQKKVSQIINRHHRKLKANQINNAAAIVLEVETGNTIAYIGNITDFSDETNGNQVDIINSERSTGSILKPFLYAAMLSSGDILPNALVYDIPTRIGGYTPKNYSRGYDGAVKAKQALARSLNIPAVRMLRQYGNERFYHKLEQTGMTTLHRNPSHYGLSLILGGCEGTLWELSGIYASMARTLNNYNLYANKYDKNDYHPPVIYFKDNYKEVKKKPWTNLENASYFDASAIWLTFDAMLEVERPEDESNWRYFESSEKIAWKTGTSFGFRDAWAIGVTPKYVVGVWAGNADGEGRPDLIGIKAAAPILFDIFDILPDSPEWFKKPLADMTTADICSESGHLAGNICPDTEEEWLPRTAERFTACPYHKMIHLDKSEKFQVTSDCEDIDNIISKAWFVLPPAVENYYKKKNSGYKYLPQYRSDCGQTSGIPFKNMELIYPFHNSKIFVPIEIDGEPGRTVFEAAHRKRSTTIFWYVDEEMVGQTKDIHQMELRPKPGEHLLTLIDEKGEKLTISFKIIDRNN